MTKFATEVERLGSLILKFGNILSDDKFIRNAPEAVVTLNRKKLSDFSDLLQKTMLVISDILKKKFDTDESIGWHVEYLRENKYLAEKNITLDTCEFDSEYFDYIYNKPVTDIELAELCDSM
jgi:hypothetical protein